VLFITDGQAWNEAELVAAVAHRRGQARFFTLGIDTAVNSSLLRRLARVGGGTCELLAPSDDIEAAVARLEARFGSPLAVDVRVEGGVPASGPPPALDPASDAPLTLFGGRPASSLLEGAPEGVRVVGRTPAGEVAWDLEPVRTAFPLAALWARDRVAALEDRITLHPAEAEALRPEILRVALAHGIASRYTAFVAVDSSVTATGERVEVIQPVELPLGWDPVFLNDTQIGPRRSGKVVSSLVQSAPAGTPVMGKLRIARLSGASQAGVAMSPETSEALRHHFAAPAPGVRVGGPLHVSAPAVPAPVPPGEQLAETLAQRQMADGSFGGEVARTAAAVITLVLLGHSRRVGLRQRVVAKAAAWLAERAGEPPADLALLILSRAEAGEDPGSVAAELEDRLVPLTTAGDEGALMEFAWRRGGG
jgi:Ca-activated chloride channel family protein